MASALWIVMAAGAGFFASPLAAHAVASLDAGARVCLGSVANCSVVGPGEGGGAAVFTGATGVGAQTSAGTPPGSAGAAQDYGIFRGRAQVIVDTPYSSAGNFWGGSASGLGAREGSAVHALLASFERSGDEDTGILEDLLASWMVAQARIELATPAFSVARKRKK